MCMPGFVSHYVFGLNAYKELSDNVLKDTIRKYKYSFSLGLQGPDLFFYFMPTSMGFKPNIANILHKQKTGEFFRQLINSVSSLTNKRDLNIAASYIEGFMGHYLLDTSMHPYVYSRVGTAVSQKILGIHFGLESDIDNAILKKYKGLKPTEFSHAAAMRLSEHEKNVIARILNIAISKTYDIEITPGLIKAAMISFEIECLLLTDKKHHKQNVISYIEKRLLGYSIVSPLLINEHKHVADPCNERHIRWSNPWDESHSSTDSAYDIIDREKDNYAQYMIEMKDALDEAYHMILPDNPLILKHLGNNSYSSGLDCSIELKRG